MRLSGKRKLRRGFTLIELLVSLTLLATMLILLGAGLRTVAQNWDNNIDKIDTLDMVSRAFDILQRDAANLQRLSKMSGNTPTFLFKGNPNELSFVVLEPPFPTKSGLYFVNYSFETSGEQNALIRSRQKYRRGMAQFTGATPANQVPLLRGNYTYKFTYGQREGEREVWHGSWPYNNRLPDLIRLEIRDVSDIGLRIPEFIVRVRADAELGCLSKGRRTLCSPQTHGALKQVSNSGHMNRSKPERDD